MFSGEKSDVNPSLNGRSCQYVSDWANSVLRRMRRNQYASASRCGICFARVLKEYACRDL